MKIKAIFRIVIPRNHTGETAFVYTDTATGKYVEGKVNANESNVRSATRVLNGGNFEGGSDSRTYVTVEEMPNRKFSAFIKGLPVVGGMPENVAEFITDGLNSPDVHVFGFFPR